MSTSSVIVTGAASGIGRATVELFAERGFGVIALDPNAEGLAELERLERVTTLVGDAALETMPTKTSASTPSRPA